MKQFGKTIKDDEIAKLYTDVQKIFFLTFLKLVNATKPHIFSAYIQKISDQLVVEYNKKYPEKL